MTQKHISQHGTFHVTTNARGRIGWCTLPGIPEIMIDNLVMTRNIHGAQVFAFCILPDHVHMVMSPGKRGLSAFMQSFKLNSSRDVRAVFADSRSWDSRIPATEVKTGDIHWQNGFHDERIRDATQRSNALTYVQYNAWRHGLIADPEGWPWSSLQFPKLIDPTEARLD